MLIVCVLCFLIMYNSSIPQRALTSFPTYLPDLLFTLQNPPRLYNNNNNKVPSAQAE
ncbi:expressed unknown protein [Ectocarpus siliculosus]|uniref:Uncharacterized protein n=1 Tax=Ectocarpus siliculosus TaxID=2880 RepID=D7FLH6_ECTSI|nr:expressed unknown protein [Ectocarpus siliculosus]|eukprot:CBJ25792.1 expressed unknown protein [Ectocarpus siliculosus]